MGWYVTCELCNKTGKYNLDCNCYNDEIRNITIRMSGCVVEETFISNNAYWQFLIQKLKPAEGPFFYIQICLADGGGDMAYPRKMQEITEAEFLQFRHTQ